MKRILSVTTAILMGASVLAAPAFAQQADGMSDTQDPGMDQTMPAPDAGVDTGTTAAIEPTFDSALTAIDGNEASATAIGAMTEVQTVNVVKVDELEGADAAAIETAVSENEEGVSQLRSSIEANAALSEQLETEGVEASSVVAAQVEADGGVTLYVM